jgi:hypothetical protein
MELRLAPVLTNASPELASQRLLAKLGLTLDELAALRRQGAVSREPRGRNCVVFKFRFRLAGRQRVMYLGTDAEQAEAVERELAEWQHSRHQSLEFARAHRTVARALRASKSRLEPLLEQAGYHFHGRAVRRRRGTPQDGASAQG